MKINSLYFSIIIIIISINSFSCKSGSKYESEILRISNADQINFLNKENISEIELEKKIDSLIKFKTPVYIKLDVDKNCSYGKFYAVRKILQKNRNNLLIAFLNTDKFYKLSAESNLEEIKVFKENQIIEINTGDSLLSLNQKELKLLDEFEKEITKEYSSLLSNQNNKRNKILVFWINMNDKSKYHVYVEIGEKLNKIIHQLKKENSNILTSIYELKI